MTWAFQDLFSHVRLPLPRLYVLTRDHCMSSLLNFEIKTKQNTKHQKKVTEPQFLKDNLVWQVSNNGTHKIKWSTANLPYLDENTLGTFSNLQRKDVMKCQYSNTIFPSTHHFNCHINFFHHRITFTSISRQISLGKSSITLVRTDFSEETQPFVVFVPSLRTFNLWLSWPPGVRYWNADRRAAPGD